MFYGSGGHGWRHRLAGISPTSPLHSLNHGRAQDFIDAVLIPFSLRFGNCLGASKSSHGFHELHGFCMMTLLVHVGSMGQLHVVLRGFSVKSVQSVARFCF